MDSDRLFLRLPRLPRVVLVLVDLPSYVPHTHCNRIPWDQDARIVQVWEEVLTDEGKRMMMMVVVMMMMIIDDDKGMFHNKDIVVEGLQSIAAI